MSMVSLSKSRLERMQQVLSGYIERKERHHPELGVLKKRLFKEVPLR